MSRIVCLMLLFSAIWIAGCSDTLPTHAPSSSTQLILDSGRSVEVSALAPGHVAVRWRDAGGAWIEGTFHQKVASGAESNVAAFSRSLDLENGRRWRTAHRMDPVRGRYVMEVEVPGRIESIAMELGGNGARYHLSTTTAAGTRHEMLDVSNPGATGTSLRGRVMQRLRAWTSSEFSAEHPELELMDELAEHPGLRDVLASLEETPGVFNAAGGLSEEASRRICSLNEAIQNTICKKEKKGPMRLICQLSDFIQLMLCSGLDELFLYEYSPDDSIGVGCEACQPDTSGN